MLASWTGLLEGLLLVVDRLERLVDSLTELMERLVASLTDSLEKLFDPLTHPAPQ